MSTTFNPYEAPKTGFAETQSDIEEYELATIKERVFARVIDNLIRNFTFFGILTLIWVIMTLTGDTAESLGDWLVLVVEEDDGYSLFSINLFDPNIYLAIPFSHGLFLLLHGVLLHRYGQTIGKRLLKIAIVDADTHKRVPLLRLVVFRYVIWDVPWLFNSLFNWCIRLVDLAFGLRADRRTLHDMTTNTIVVKVNRLTIPNAPTLERLARLAQSRGA